MMGNNAHKHDHERPADRILGIVFHRLNKERDVYGNVIIDSQTASKLDECYEEMGWSLQSRNVDKRHEHEHNANNGVRNSITDGVDESKSRRRTPQVELLDPAPSEATADFIYVFEQKLKNDGIIANRIERISDSGRIVLLICNMSSRLATDIGRVLKSVRNLKSLSDEDYGRIVLIALHVKDKRALPEEKTKDNLSFQESYHGFKGVVDIAFTREKGLYNCSMNDTANTEMRRLFEGTV